MFFVYTFFLATFLLLKRQPRVILLPDVIKRSCLFNSFVIFTLTLVVCYKYRRIGMLVSINVKLWNTKERETVFISKPQSKSKLWFSVTSWPFCPSWYIIRITDYSKAAMLTMY